MLRRDLGYSEVTELDLFGGQTDLIMTELDGFAITHTFT